LTQFETDLGEACHQDASIAQSVTLTAARKKAMQQTYWEPLLELPGGIVDAFTEEYKVRFPHLGLKRANVTLPPAIDDFLRMLTCMELHPPPEDSFIAKAEACRKVSVEIANG